MDSWVKEIMTNPKYGRSDFNPGAFGGIEDKVPSEEEVIPEEEKVWKDGMGFECMTLSLGKDVDLNDGQ